jgi:hypothetical protein
LSFGIGFSSPLRRPVYSLYFSLLWFGVDFGSWGRL